MNEPHYVSVLLWTGRIELVLVVPLVRYPLGGEAAARKAFNTIWDAADEAGV